MGHPHEDRRLTGPAHLVRSDVMPELLMCTGLVRAGCVDGCLVTILQSRDDLVHLAATDDAVRTLVEVQFSHWEGAAPEVVDSGSPVVVDDVRAEHARWPLTTPLAAGLEPRALAVLPVRRRGTTVGVLAAHRVSTRTFDDADLEDLVAFAGSLSVVVAGRVTGPDELVLPSSPIAMAVGMVMSRLGLGPDDALATIRAHAFTHERTVPSLAHDLVVGAVAPHELDDA